MRPARMEREDEAATLVALAAVAGVALAETLTGNDRDNRLIGTNQRDSIGGAGNDDIFAGPTDERARDTVVGGRGKDFVQVFNRPAAKDVLNCGKDRARGIVDSEDVLSDCERVRRR